MDPTVVVSWLPFIERVGVPGAILAVIAYFVYRFGFWCSEKAVDFGKWAAPLVVELVGSFSAFTTNVTVRLASLEGKTDAVGRGVRDVHRRLDANGFCPVADNNDSEDGTPPARKSGIHSVRKEPQ